MRGGGPVFARENQGKVGPFLARRPTPRLIGATLSTWRRRRLTRLRWDACDLFAACHKRAGRHVFARERKGKAGLLLARRPLKKNHPLPRVFSAGQGGRGDGEVCPKLAPAVPARLLIAGHAAPVQLKFAPMGSGG